MAPHCSWLCQQRLRQDQSYAQVCSGELAESSGGAGGVIVETMATIVVVTSASDDMSSWRRTHLASNPICRGGEGQNCRGHLELWIIVKVRKNAVLSYKTDKKWNSYDKNAFFETFTIIDNCNWSGARATHRWLQLLELQSLVKLGNVTPQEAEVRSTSWMGVLCPGRPFFS